ncbi:MAG: hypothetical protein A2Y10_16680 [Planctomycetes bacterium GWF2_41_51]|nr:MAG: hypothetical protein A2Y10_16680 [Planctomycetes bacterium GWF2_41_51]HBG28897.1 16S rRNA (cytosine(967)-C(5))-methyltransferase RsmB [Phycisphaerales bacterium]
MVDVKYSARRAVWEVLNQFKAEKQDASLLIDKFSAKTENRAAVIDITFGVIRNSIFIDNFISQISGRPTKNIQPKLVNCLRIAVYELVFTEQAQYAIVNEAVELAKQTGSKKASGFINAVLRKVVASIKNKNAKLSETDSKKTLPLTSEAGCEFTIEILPAEKKDKAEYLSRAFSLPLWLIELWISQFGYEKAKNVCFASNRRPSIYARPNRLKTTAEELINVLKSENVDCEIVEQYKMVKLNKTGNIAQLESFKNGLFTIQDLTASSVVSFLNPQSGWKIFDICAAPGTKTTHIAEMADDKELVTATDIDDSRLHKINENVNRLGVKSVKILSYNDFLKESSKLIPVEAVLLDVPCSNTGVLAKRAEVRLRLDKKQIHEIAKIQSQLLESASKFISKGGRICYSTCSILNEENNEIVNNFLKNHKEFSLEKEKLTLPSAASIDCDGGYAAVIMRK